MNSGDINLTQTEIAKAFQILRKYRYVAGSPQRNTVVVESDNARCSALPYLDLADSSVGTSKRQSVSDWVNNISDSACQSSVGITLTEHSIGAYCSHHPLYAKVYKPIY